MEFLMTAKQTFSIMSSTKGKLLQYIFLHFEIVFHNEDSTDKQWKYKIIRYM